MSEKHNRNTHNNNKRRLLKTVLAGSTGAMAGKALPEQWLKPVVDSVLLPAHASTSDGSGSLPGENVANYFGSVSAGDAVYQICIQCDGDNCSVQVLESYPQDAESLSVYFYQGTGLAGAAIVLTQPNACDLYTVELEITGAGELATGRLNLLDEDKVIESSTVFSIPQNDCGISSADAVCDEQEAQNAQLKSAGTLMGHH